MSGSPRRTTLRLATTQAEREQPKAVTLIQSADGKHLCKTYIQGCQVQPYDNVFRYKSMTWIFKTIDDLATLLEEAAEHPTVAVIRGAIKPHFDENEPHVRRTKDRGDRWGAPYRDVPRSFFMADIDGACIEGLSVLKDPVGTIRHVLKTKLPPELQDVDCVIQLSSSAGLLDSKFETWRFGDGPTISLHVFFLLDHPVAEKRLRYALKQWDLDPSLAGAVQLHYIANPLFFRQKGCFDEAPIEDKIEQRWFVIKGSRPVVRLADLPSFAAKNSSAGKRKPSRTGASRPRPRRHSKRRSFVELVAAIGKDGDYYEAALAAVHHATMRLLDDDWLENRQRIFDRLDVSASPDLHKSDLDRYRDWCLSERENLQTWQDEIPDPYRDHDFAQQKVESARSRLGEDIERWFLGADRQRAFSDEAQRPPFNAIVRSSPGLGKTTAVLKEAAKRRFPLDFYIASHRDGEERQRELDVFASCRTTPVPIATKSLSLKRPLSIVERGRTARDPLERLDASPLMCGRVEAFKAVLASGVDSPRKVMCDSCPLRGDCGSYAQLEGIKAVRSGRGVVFSPHAYSIKQRRHHDGRAAVIDEDAISQHWTREPGPKLANLDPKVAKAVTSDRPILSLVRQLGSRRKAAKYLRLLLKMQPRLRKDYVSGDMRDEKIIEVTKEATTRTQFRRLYTALLRAVIAGWTRADHIEIDNGRVWIYSFSESRLDPETPLLILDATARPELLEAVYQRDFEIIGEQLPERLDITRVRTTGSKAALYLWSDESDIADMASELAKFAKDKPCLVVVHKSHRGAWQKTLPDNFEIEHFGNLRGTNEFAKFDHAVIVGRQQPPPQTFIRQAAALRLARGDLELPKPSADLEQAKSGYFYHPETGQEFHPDPVVEALRWSACEGEIIQAVGRLRSSIQPTLKNLLLVTDLSIPGLVPARTIRLSELRTAKPDSMRASINFMLNRFGGLVMTRSSFAKHTAITSKTYRREAFDEVRGRCIEVSFIKLYGQSRLSKALVLCKRADEAQAIIEQIEGNRVIIKGSISGDFGRQNVA